MRWIPVALLVAVLAWSAPARASGDVEDRHLVLAGLGMAVPTYFLGVTVHEGSHALAAKLMGAEVTRFRVLPWRHPDTGAFYFGYTAVRGRFTDRQRTFFLIAPKLADLALLGGYAVAVAGDALPSNDYGRLAFAVLATGFWVDFTRDVFAFRPQNDMLRIYAMRGAHGEWERLPYRALHAAIAAAAAVALVHEYRGLFGDDDAPEPATLMLPLWLGAF